jgi:hypothetical protein
LHNALAEWKKYLQLRGRLAKNARATLRDLLSIKDLNGPGWLPLPISKDSIVLLANLLAALDYRQKRGRPKKTTKELAKNKVGRPKGSGEFSLEEVDALRNEYPLFADWARKNETRPTKRNFAEFAVWRRRRRGNRQNLSPPISASRYASEILTLCNLLSKKEKTITENTA